MIKNIYDTCFNCKNNKFFVRRREVPVPGTNLIAKSREKLCGKCYKAVLKEVSKGRKYD
jgi:hypothetical protein